MWRRKQTIANVTVGEPSPNDHSRASSSNQGGDRFEETEACQPESENPQNMPWSDNITIPKDDVLLTIDGDGNYGIKRGQVQLSQLWVLESMKFVVKLNEFNQPIGKGGHLLVRFLGEEAKDGNLCPIGEENWHKVHSSYKLDIVTLTRSKFEIVKGLDINKKILSHVNGKWKTYKHTLKDAYFDHNKIEAQIASNVPKDVKREQWVRLVHYWFSPTGKKLSIVGKKARSLKADCHTTGSKSFAQKKFEFEKSESREPSIFEVWKITHQRKDGSYIQDINTKEFLEAAKTLVDERIGEHPELPKTSTEDAVFTELMYDENTSSQRVVGYGHGGSRRQVFGLKVDLRKLDYVEDFTNVRGKLASIEKENENLKNAHVSIVKENEQLKNSHANLHSQLHCIKFALAMHGIVLDDPTGRDANVD